MKKVMALLLAISMLFPFVSCSKHDDELDTTPIPPAAESRDEERENASTPAQQVKSVEWPEITENGVDENLLISNIDIPTLEIVATEFQTLVDEAGEEERQNPEIVLTEGFPRVFKTERYKRVVAMGEIAMKPLYLIIYKSEYAGMYEYICARALCDLSGADFDWCNSKEFLEKFNRMILDDRQQ